MGPPPELPPPRPAPPVQPVLPGDPLTRAARDRLHVVCRGHRRLQLRGFGGLVAGVLPGLEGLVAAVPAHGTGIGAAAGVQNRGVIFAVRGREEGLD